MQLELSGVQIHSVPERPIPYWIRFSDFDLNLLNEQNTFSSSVAHPEIPPSLRRRRKAHNVSGFALNINMERQSS